jgi:translocator protein
MHVDWTIRSDHGAQVSATTKSDSMRLIPFLVIVVGGGLLIGATNLPGPWYAELAKPAFTPPNWLFAPAWTVLYVLIAIAGWRTFQQQPRGLAMGLWYAQLALNFAWSPTMFTLHAIALALIVIVAMLTTIIAFIVVQWPRDRIAACLFLPYAAWAGFATALNFAVWQLNSGKYPTF